MSAEGGSGPGLVPRGLSPPAAPQLRARPALWAPPGPAAPPGSLTCGRKGARLPGAPANVARGPLALAAAGAWSPLGGSAPPVHLPVAGREGPFPWVHVRIPHTEPLRGRRVLRPARVSPTETPDVSGQGPGITSWPFLAILCRWGKGKWGRRFSKGVDRSRHGDLTGGTPGPALAPRPTLRGVGASGLWGRQGRPEVRAFLVLPGNGDLGPSNPCTYVS